MKNIFTNYLLSVCLLFGALSPLSAQTYTTIPYRQGFESSTSFGSYSEITSSGTSAYNNEIISDYDPYRGNNALLLDVTTDNTNSINDVRFHFNLSGQTQVELSFYLEDLGDEDHANDGIYFSDNGGSSFTKVYSLTPASYSDWVYQEFVLDIDALAGANALSLTSNFVIKFQHEDNWPTPDDGFLIDEVAVYNPNITTTAITTTPSCVGAADGTASVSSTAGDGDYAYFWPDAISAGYSPVEKLAHSTNSTAIAATGTNRLLVVAVTARSPYTNPTTVTYGGQNMTFYAQENTIGGDRDVILQYYYLDEAGIAAASGSTVAVTAHSWWVAYRHHSVMFGNVDQDNPVGIATTAVEANTNDASLTMASQVIKMNQFNLIAVGNGEQRNVTANTGLLSGYTEYTDETYAGAGGTGDDLGISIHGYQVPSSQTKASADVTMSGSVDSKAAIALIINPEASYITGLTAGTYALTTTDVHLNTKTTNVTITDPTPVSITLTPVDQNGYGVSCNGGSDGIVNSSVSGGTVAGAYSYLWSVSAQTTSGVSGLNIGTYTVTVEDDNGCTSTSSITLTQPSALASAPSVSVQAAYNGEDVSCSGAADGIIQAGGSGGVTPYTYQWNAAALSSTNTTVLGIAAGTGYVVTITDANGCQVSGGVTVTQPVSVSVSTVVNTTVTCNGDNDGQVTASGSGGTGAFSYTWSTNAGSQSTATGAATALSAGTYTVTVSDANGCTQVSSAVTVSEPSAIASSVTSTTNILCNGAATGAIDITVSGGNTPFTYLWSDASTTQDLSSMSQGTYTVTISDANSCTSTLSATLTQPSALAASASSTIAETCFGASDGSIDLNATGGTTPYAYLWSTTATTQDISGLTGASYTVTVTDGNSCVDGETIVVNGSGALLSLSAAATSVTCNGEATGAIDLTVSNGTAPFSYIWDNPASSTIQDIATLSAGTYNVTVTDTYNCIKILSETITENAGMSISTSVTDISTCATSDGAINVTITLGYSTNYTYVWNNAETTENITGLIAGIYTVTVNDGTCDQIFNETVSVVGGVHAITATSNDVTCNGGSDGSVSAGITVGNPLSDFLWSEASTTETVTGLTPGIYTVTVTDNNCNAIESVTVSEPATLVSVSITANNSVSCVGGNDGSLTAVGSGSNGGPFTYLWDDGGSQTTSTATGLVAGDYSVTATDVSGICFGVTTVTLAEPSAISITDVMTEPNCFGGSDGTIDITVAGGTVGTGYSYVWTGTGVSANAEDQSTASAGNYFVTVTDGNGCTETASYTMTQPTNVTLSTAVTSNYNGEDISCDGENDGAATVTPAGGNGVYTYLWDNGEVTAAAISLDEGVHTVTVYDNGLCAKTDNITITAPNVIMPNASISSAILCTGDANGSAIAAPSGGTGAYTFAWSTGQTTATATGLFAGPTYKVSVSDANSCLQVQNVTLSNPPNITLTANVTSNYNGEDISCTTAADGQATAALTGGTGAGFTYLWSNTKTTASITGLVAGTYTVTASDGNACSTTGSVTLVNPAALVVDASISSNYNGEEIACFGGSNGSASTAITQVGTVGGGYTYVWTNGSTASTATGLNAGTYTVTLTDGNGCTATDNVVFTNPAAITVTSDVTSSYGAGNYETSCSYSSNASASVSPSGGTITTTFAYLWSNAQTTAATTSALSAGTHTVTVTDNNGCTATSSVTVTAAPIIVANASQVDVAVSGSSTGQASVVPSGGQNPYTYLWTQVPGVISAANETNSAITNMPADTYNMTITDANGCTLPVVFVIIENASLAGGSITHAEASGAILNVCKNDVAVTNIMEAVAGNATGGDGVYTYTWETSSDFVSWSTIVPVVTTTDYTNTFNVTSTQIIRRKVQDGAGATAYSNSMILLSVDTTTTLSFMETDYCVNDNTVYNSLVSPSSAGSLWVFNDLVSPANTTLTTNGNGTGQLNPSLFPVGSHNVTHQYTNGNGCISTLVTPITIHGVTPVNFDYPSTVFTLGSTPLTLEDYVDLPGGDFSGPGVSYVNVTLGYQFNPSVPGLSTIDYTYTDGNGCITTDDDVINVVTNAATLEVNGNIVDLDEYYCMKDLTFTVIADPGASGMSILDPGVKPSVTITEAWSVKDLTSNSIISNDSLGVVSGDQITYTINSNNVPINGNSYLIKYTYVSSLDSATILSVEHTMRFSDNYHVDFYTSNLDQDFEFCNADATVSIIAVYTKNNAQVGFGTFNSTENTDDNDDVLLDAPIANGFGQYYPVSDVLKDTITYTYTIPTSGCVVDTSHIFTVHPLPVITIDFAYGPEYCLYDKDTVTPSPFGGTFSWAGVNTSGGLTNFTVIDTISAGTSFPDQTICVHDYDGGNGSCNFTASLCDDGYQYGTNSYSSGNFTLNSVYNDVIIKLYYTSCSGIRSFNVYLNGNFVTNITGTEASCSCNPTTYPDVFNLSGALFDSFINIGGNNIITIEIPTSDLYVSGIIAEFKNAPGTPPTVVVQNYAAFDASQVVSTGGLKRVKYEYTDSNGCTDSKLSSNRIIHPKPNVFFNVDPLFNIVETNDSIFAGVNNQLLSSITVSGPGIIDPGYFYGTDSIGSIFDAATAGIGIHTIELTYTDTNSCTFSASKNTEVQEASGAFFGIPGNNYYCIDGATDKIWAIPGNGNGVDGDYSGPGVTDMLDDTASFDPTSVAAGVHTISYTYMGFDNTTPFTITTDVNVADLGLADILSLDAGYCVNAPADNITGFPNAAGTGIFAATTGLTSVGSDATFDPSVAGVGNHNIDYTFTETLSGCSIDTIIQTEVFDLPTPDFTLNSIYNVAGATETLVGIPSGGTFSGDGIVADDFSPSMAGIGTAYVTYELIDINGCSGSIVHSTEVEKAGGVFTVLNYYCIDGSDQQIWADPANGDGSFGSFTGTGVLDQLDDTALFQPSTLADGQYVISYTYFGSDGTTEFTIDTTVNVIDLGSASINSLNAGYCIDANTDTLFGLPNTLGVGAFTPIPGLNVAMGDSAVINPPAMGGSGFYDITYEYTHDVSGCVISTTSQVEIYALPTPDFVLNSIYNIVGENDTLHGIPSGGTFSGSAMTDSIFSPATALLGLEDVTYTYTDILGCTNFVTHTTDVQKASGTFFFPEILPTDYYCIDSQNDTIKVIIDNDNGTDGEFVGLGITDLNDKNAAFAPNTLSVGTYPISYTYKGIDGATEFTIDTVINVSGVPVININQPNDEFCVDDDPFTYSGFPSGGIFYGTGMTGPTFSPNQVGVTTSDVVVQVNYRYIEPVSTCQRILTRDVTVHPLPSVSVASNFVGNYCIDADTVLVQGLVNLAPAGLGNFSGLGVVNNSNTGAADYVPAMVGVDGENVNDTIWFTYTHPTTGCTNTTSKSTLIRSLPNPSISGLDTAYCQNFGEVSLTGEDLFNLSTGVGTWNINNSPSGNKFNTQTLPSGLIPIAFTFTLNTYGCTKTVNDTTVVNPMPTASFTVGDHCMAHPTEFFSTSTVDGVLGDEIVEWTWSFGDVFVDSLYKDSAYIENPIHQYSQPFEYVINLEVVTNNGCSDVVDVEDRRIKFGANPPVNFSWLNECLPGANTEFTVDQETQDFPGVNSYKWKFGDGVTTTLASTVTSTDYGYPSTDAFDVTLVAYTESGCVDSATKTINIREVHTPGLFTPYLTDFETDNDGWIPETAEGGVSSWALGEPNKTYLNSAYSGTNAYATSLDSTYFDNEKSWLASPCYDFSNLRRPMIKLRLNSKFASNDGLVLQSSVDAGQTWQNVGSVNTGIDWFNTSGIEGNPGNQGVTSGFVGWSGSTDSTWIESRNVLDSLVGETSIRFRLALGANSLQSDEGVAIDDIWIGERTKNVLLEHFTNSSTADVIAADNHINNLTEANPLDVVTIQYHTSFPGEDQMNKDNPSVPRTRALYYGISKVPNSSMDGNQFNGVSTILTQPRIDNRKLTSPAFEIYLNTEVVGSTLEINSQLKALRDFSQREVSLHIAIVEQEITSLTGSNGQTVFKNVLKDMLPDASGTTFDQSWIYGQTATVSETYTMANFYNTGMFKVVAYVQDNTTKEIYQVAYNDESILSTSIKDLVEEMNSTGFVVYPNPTNSIANIEFESDIKDNTTVKIFNQTGSWVQEIRPNVGDRKTSIDMTQLESGVYYIQVDNNGERSVAKKLVVLH